MKLLKLLFLLCVTTVFAQVPGNNECANAEPITVTTTSVLTISADFTEATESLDASCNTVSVDNRDLWYQFTMPIDGNLYINGPSSLNYFSLYESCGGSELVCSQDDASFGNLVNGNTYLLRTSFQFSGITSFTLQAVTPIANDECDNRETIVISATNFIQPNPDSSSATESVIASCDSSNNTYLDVWYEFVMPVNGTVDVTLANNTQTFALYDACAGSELQCFSNNGLFQNLNQNTTYILRVAERSTDAGQMNFRLQAYEYASNDECVNSQTITVETANSNTYQADLRTATESLDAFCETASNTNFDLWYNFTMPVTGNLKIDQLTGLDTATIYDSCGGAEISCQSGLQFVSGLVEGTNYALRIASISPVNRQPRLQAFPLAANNECVNSELLTVVTENTTNYTVDTRTATESIDSSCNITSDINLDLWYDIVMPVSGNLQISSTIFSLKTALFDACSGTEIDCADGNTNYENLAFNTTYKLRVSQRTNEANSTSFELQAFENIFNDECATPQDITVLENEFITYSTNNAAATSSLISSCEPSSFAVLDVWYRFTMLNDNDIEIEHLNDALNGYYALYDACGTTELQCFVNDGFFNNLIGGSEYLLKVGNTPTQPGVLSFNISAQSESLSIEDFTFNDVIVYPSPVKDILTIKNPKQFDLKTLSIYDMNGREIKVVAINNATENEIIDISELANATYILKIKSSENQVFKRIIKE
jgi:hypothetical protein